MCTFGSQEPAQMFVTWRKWRTLKRHKAFMKTRRVKRKTRSGSDQHTFQSDMSSFLLAYSRASFPFAHERVIQMRKTGRKTSSQRCASTQSGGVWAMTAPWRTSSLHMTERWTGCQSTLASKGQTLTMPPRPAHTRGYSFPFIPKIVILRWQVWKADQRHVFGRNCPPGVVGLNQRRSAVQRARHWNAKNPWDLWNKVPVHDREVGMQTFTGKCSVQVETCLLLSRVLVVSL